MRKDSLHRFPTGSFGYQLYKRYVRFFNNHLHYRHVYYLHREHIPSLGEPCMIVSNHQNCANDPLNLLLGLENESHPYVIARGNVFDLHPMITRFFLWLGMLPAFRLQYDGEDSLSKNGETIRISGGKMMEGHRLIMYPEGGHQDKRWLGDFSFGYTRLAFQTAEKDGFRHDIKILPSAHHYSDYFELQSDVLITFGTPISLEPYYALYQEKPRTAQREVNKLVRAQIEEMMLDIRDLEHYTEIDWIRNSTISDTFCKQQGGNPHYLPDKLRTDKLLVKKLNNWEDWNAVRVVREKEQKFGVTDKDVERPIEGIKLVLSIIAQIILLPLFCVSLYPNIIHYNIHRPLLKTDKMFTNTYRFILPVVLGIPFFLIFTILICGLVWGLWWQSTVWMLLATYPLARFALWDWQWMKQTMRSIKIKIHSQEIAALRQRRQQLFEQIKSKLSI